MSKTTKASFRIFSATLDPDAISEVIGLSPSAQHRKGEPKSKRLPDVFWDENYWSYKSPLSEVSELHEHLNFLAEILEPKQKAIESIRHATTGIDIFCMFSSENGQGSAEFDPLLLKRLAGLNIEVILDLYPPALDSEPIFGKTPAP